MKKFTALALHIIETTQTMAAKNTKKVIVIKRRKKVDGDLTVRKKPQTRSIVDRRGGRVVNKASS